MYQIHISVRTQKSCAEPLKNTTMMQVRVNLHALPQVTLSTKKVPKPTKKPGCQKCSICLDEVGSNPRVETLEGSFVGGPAYWIGCHVFCTCCIAHWVSNGTCPECRQPVRADIIRDLRSKVPRRSRRVSGPPMMFTTDGHSASSVSSQEMMQRVEDIPLTSSIY